MPVKERVNALVMFLARRRLLTIRQRTPSLAALFEAGLHEADTGHETRHPFGPDHGERDLPIESSDRARLDGLP